MEIAGDKQVEVIKMSEISDMIHVEIPRTDTTADVRSRVQQFSRAVKAVDRFTTFLSTIGENFFDQPTNVPTNGKVPGPFKNRTNEWIGIRDVVIYVIVRTRVTAGASRKALCFNGSAKKGFEHGRMYGTRSHSRR